MKTIKFDMTSAQASVQLVRNATLVLNYNGSKILVDPMFSEKGAFHSFAGIQNNPTVSLRISVPEITDSIDFVLVTHTHPDHFDKVASQSLDKSVVLFHQPSDTEFFRSEHFENARSVNHSVEWREIELIRVEAQHGSGDVLSLTGKASGFIIRANAQPTIYLIGDGILTEDVKANIQKYEPDYIIVNSGGAILPGFQDSPILMNEEQTISLVKAEGKARFIAVHMEALDHCLVTRTTLRKKAEEASIQPGKLIIPQDGETILM